jgi:hypothetical protein
MKKILCNVLLMIISAPVFAQPTLTATSCNPVPGESFYGHYCETAGVDKGASGTSVTWDLSGLVTLSMDTTSFIACSSSTTCDTFPGSNLVSPQSGDYAYYVADANKFGFNGYSQSGANEYFSDPQASIMYPMTYGDVKVDTFVSAQPGFQYYSHGIDSFFADAYGTLKLPSGVYNNVLRVHVLIYETDSAATTTTQVDKYKSEVYFWYKAGFHYPLAMMSYDTSGTGTNVPVILDAVYYPFSTAGVSLVENQAANVQVYPNPATDLVHLNVSLANGGQVSIGLTDMLGKTAGKTIDKYVGSGTSEMTYDVSVLPAGTYLLKVTTPAGTDVQKIQVSK